jgi:uncharacterized delta-60 repeat protein
MANIILSNTNPINTPIPPMGSTLMFFDLNSQPFLKDSSGVIQGFGSGGGGFYDNGNSSVNTSIDWGRGNLQQIVIDDNPTLSFTGAEAGQRLTLLLSRGVGERRVITWSDGIFWRDGETFRLKKVNNVALDGDFVIGDGFNGTVNSITLQSDGKILVGGGFTQFDSNQANYLVRLNANGTLDTSFNIGTGFNTTVQSIALQPDGKILVGGLFTLFNGNTINRLVRLNADGTLDGGFNIGTGFNTTVLSIALQPDGKILVGGLFTQFDGNTINRLVRLNADGTLDMSFTIGTGFNERVQSIALQSDGKIIVGGRFTQFDGNTVGRIVRLNGNGTIDSGFDMSTGFNGPVQSIALQSGGKIIVGGGFTQFNGNTVNHLARLNGDGTLDTSFTIGTGFSGSVAISVETITLQPDGKIIVGGGQFTSFDGNPANRLVRLNGDGSLDTGFNIGSGFNTTVQSIALQSDGKIIVGGSFQQFDGNTANLLARLVELSGNIYTPVDFYWTGTQYIGTY